MRRIKLIWDMLGADSLPTAEHHARHLKQFADKEDIAEYGSGAEQLSNSHSIAYLIVDENDMITVRDALRPKRAEVADHIS